MRSVFHLKFLVHVIHNLVLPHDVLQKSLPSWRLVLALILCEDVSRCKKHYFSEPFLVSIFALLVSLSSRWYAVSWSFRSISNCAPFSMFVSIHSTSSLRQRGFEILVTSVVIETSSISAGCVLVAAAARTRTFGVCSRRNLVLHLCNCSFRLETRFSLCLVLRGLLHKFLLFFTASTSRCAVCSWMHHSASQNSCRS